MWTSIGMGGFMGTGIGWKVGAVDEQVRHHEEEMESFQDAVDWADWDSWDRLVFVRRGGLYAAHATGAVLEERLLCDFNPFEPRELAPPQWARTW